MKDYGFLQINKNIWQVVEYTGYDDEDYIVLQEFKTSAECKEFIEELGK